MLTIFYNAQVADTLYNRKPKENVVIEATGDYTCIRQPIMLKDNKVGVFITCAEDGEDVFTLGTVCRTDIINDNDSMLTVVIGGKSVMFMVSCETKDNSGQYLNE